MSCKAMDRRTFLRGTMAAGGLVAVGLPVFEAMLNSNGVALANGDLMPLRYGTWFWGVGAYPNDWAQSTSGDLWVPSACLSPLAPVAPYMSLISNTRFTNVPVVHYGGQAFLLTGKYNSRGSDQATDAFGAPGGPSTDQIVAQAWKGRTPTASVAMGVSYAYQGGCLGGANGACTPPTQASWLGDNKPNYHEFSLRNFYNTLFGSANASNATFAQKKSILDVVSQDMNNLRQRLGKADTLRLDAHAQAIRDMEASIEMTKKSCTVPMAVADIDSPLAKEPLQERNRAFADMLVLALSCDLTRVFTLQFTGRENDAVFWQVGATSGVHTLSHENSSASRATLKSILSFTMGELSYLLQKMQATKDGVGNLLDNSCIYITSCIGDPTAHSYDRQLLLMLAGKAGGKLKGGVHYIAQDNDQAMAVPLTAMRAVGVNVPQFGPDNMLATASLQALLA